MKNKIEALPTLKAAASASAVEMLEEMLALAKSGEVTEVMIVGLCRDGNIHNWATPMTKTFAMLGGLEQLKFDILQTRSHH